MKTTLKPPCVVPECDRPQDGRGPWCQTHYVHWWKTGRVPRHAVRPKTSPPEERFWAKVEKTATCWLWTGAKCAQRAGEPSGKYGNFDYTPAHRVSYEWAHGPIPAGLVIDHLCRNGLCVRPDHLEPVTPGENVLRGNGPPGLNHRKTHCCHGHPFSRENTYITTGGGRSCRTCRRERDRAAARKRTTLLRAS